MNANEHEQEYKCPECGDDSRPLFIGHDLVKPAVEYHRCLHCGHTATMSEFEVKDADDSSKFQSLAEWAETPGGQAFMNQPPDRDLMQENARR